MPRLASHAFDPTFLGDMSAIVQQRLKGVMRGAGDMYDPRKNENGKGKSAEKNNELVSLWRVRGKEKAGWRSR